MIYIIIPCKGRLEHLKQCIPAILQSTFEKFSVIVVDYQCPEGTSEWVKSLKEKRVKVINPDVHPEAWNMSSAFNEGFKATKAKDNDLILFIGADAVLQPEFLINAISDITETQRPLFSTGTNDYAYGCCIITAAAVRAVNGFNECLEEWGYEDVDFFERVEVAGWQRINLPPLISTIDHGDELRTQFTSEKDKWVTNSRNAIISKLRFKGLDGVLVETGNDHAVLIASNPNAEIKTIKGRVPHMDKDFVLIDGQWRPIANGDTWNWLKECNANARGRKTYVSQVWINNQPQGEVLSI